MKLTAAQRAFVRRCTKGEDEDPSASVGELNIVPFLDIVVNMIVFMLVVAASVMAVAQVYAQLPSRGPHAPRQALNLNVVVTDRGIIVAGSGGKLAPDCRTLATGPVITVPTVGGAQDLAALRTCVAQVKSAYPEEDEITITADPAIAYEDVIHVMDAVRQDAGRSLFPDVRLSAGVR